MDEKEVFDAAFTHLIDIGLITIVGINDDGEWLYSLSEDGKKFVETFYALDDFQIQPYGEDG